jgi:hypothetical protein
VLPAAVVVGPPALDDSDADGGEALVGPVKVVVLGTTVMYGGRFGAGPGGVPRVVFVAAVPRLVANPRAARATPQAWNRRGVRLASTVGVGVAGAPT